MTIPTSSPIPSPALVARRITPRAPLAATMAPRTRTCGRCARVQPLEEFPAAARTRSGISSVCGTCLGTAGHATEVDPQTLRRSCISKRAYPTFEKAVHAALVANRRRGTPLRVYRCDHTRLPPGNSEHDAPTLAAEHFHLTKRTSWPPAETGEQAAI